MLDPRSAEGHFRYKIEEPLAVDDPVDINAALKEIRKTLAIYKGQPQECFRARLYEHCPFSFLFFTDAAVFTEQYYYRTSDREANLPLTKFAQDTAQYQILSDSLRTIWDNAAEAGIEIGTAIPIEEARIRNIYLAHKRGIQSQHQVARIKSHRGNTIDILNITAGHYVTDYDPSSALQEFSAKRNENGGTIRFALLNPVSQQAILRAIADECRAEEIGETLRTYNWRTHQHSKLYTRIRETTGAINRWKEEGHRVELRLYSCSTTCALLLTSESAFVGHYLYGRSRKLQVENRLQSEYPMLEFAGTPPDSPQEYQLEIMHSTFNVVWDHYSISYEDYKLLNKEETFEKNLKRLREELCLPPA